MEGEKVYRAKFSLPVVILMLTASIQHTCNNSRFRPIQSNHQKIASEKKDNTSTASPNTIHFYQANKKDDTFSVDLTDFSPVEALDTSTHIVAATAEADTVDEQKEIGIQAEPKNVIQELVTQSFLSNSRPSISDSIRNPQQKISYDKQVASGSVSEFDSELQQQSNMNDQLKAAFTTKLLYDSVIVSSNKEFVYNTLTINNTTNARLSLQVFITAPLGWQMVTTNLVNITLEPLANTIIPMRFSPSGNNTAEWQHVKIEYRMNNVIDTRRNYFKMKVQEYSSFKATLPNSNIVLTSYHKNLEVPVYIKNSGNTKGAYNVSIINQLLKLNNKFAIPLNPGKDTLLRISVLLSESQFAMLKKEEIRIAVANEKKETINMIQNVSKVGHLLKDHVSAFLDMPLQLEAGVMYQGNESPAQYYGALYGNVDFDNDNHLAMFVRSNTIAKGQTNNNGMVRMDFSGKHVHASAGNIQGAGDFTADGYGIRAGYQWNDVKRLEAFGVIKSRTGNAKLFGATYQTGIKDNVRITNSVTVNNDDVRKTNSGILHQISEYQFAKGRIALITGIGSEQNNSQTLVDGAQKEATGTSVGYNFQYTGKSITAFSNVLYNGNSYPGVFKGQRLQMHDVRWNKSNFSADGFYEYNFRMQNYWQDTLFFKDVFNLKTTNYGARVGINLKKSSVQLAAGNQRQMQQGADNFQTNYDYLNLNFSSLIAKNLHVNVNSFGGMISQTGGSTKVFVATSQGSVQIKNVGATFRYDHGPYFYQEFATYLNEPTKFEKLIVSPFAEARFFKNALNTRIQANYAKTLPSNVSTSNILGNINYSHPDGYDVNINGIFPLGGSGSSQPFISAAVRMRLKAPCVAVRKYYDLKLVLFKDENSNGIKDAGEEPIAGQTLSLNKDLFVSDGNGLVYYKNTEKGIYSADFGYSSKLRGWIPNEGTTQQFELSGNKTIYIPYKTSRVLSGHLMVHNDSLSNTKFNPSNIKIIATGSKGGVFSTLTDDNGEFYFNLPSDNYIVTVSEAAFSEQFWPVQFSQTADLVNNQSKAVYFEIKQKKRQINIKKK